MDAYKFDNNIINSKCESRAILNIQTPIKDLLKDLNENIMFGVGCSDFKKFRECFLYIDMTELIYHVINSGNEAISFNFPRRFGKTLNLSMLRYFLRLRFDQNGEPY